MQNILYQVNDSFYVVPFYFLEDPHRGQVFEPLEDSYNTPTSFSSPKLQTVNPDFTSSPESEWIDLAKNPSDPQNPDGLDLASLALRLALNRGRTSSSIQTVNSSYTQEDFHCIPQIILPPDASTTDFELLLRIIKPLAAPIPAAVTSLTLQEWFSVLHLATSLDISYIRSLALAEIKNIYQIHQEELRIAVKMQEEKNEWQFGNASGVFIENSMY